MSKFFGATGLALVLQGAFAFSASDVAAQTPKSGGTLSFAIVASPPSYDCHAETTFAVVHPVAPHYSLLLKIDAAKYPNVAGDLAESWAATSDGLTYTFKLHKGVKFHDGSPLTSADVKATYERIIRPPVGVVSVRQSYYEDFGEHRNARRAYGGLQDESAGGRRARAAGLAVQLRLQRGETEEQPELSGTRDHGIGCVPVRRARAGIALGGEALRGLFKPGRPYLDGYKAYFVKSPAVVPGLLGDQFDAEFRFRTPPERDALVEKLGDKVSVHELALLGGNIFIFNTKRKPYDDIRVRQALSLAVDRWTGGANIGKISSLRYVGGVNRPGSTMALPEAELEKLPGYWKDAEKSRAEAQRLLKEAGQENLAFKFLNRAGIESYTTGGIYAVDQWRRIGVKATHEQLETKQYQENLATGNYDVAMEFISDYLDDPTQNFVKFLSKKLTPLGYSGHEDTKIDELYEAQRRALDPVERTKIVRALDSYVMTTAYSVPFLWSQRIMVLHKKVQGWHMTPTHYLSQDLVDVWLDR